MFKDIVIRVTKYGGSTLPVPHADTCRKTVNDGIYNNTICKHSLHLWGHGIIVVCH